MYIPDCIYQQIGYLMYIANLVIYKRYTSIYTSANTSANLLFTVHSKFVGTFALVYTIHHIYCR